MNFPAIFLQSLPNVFDIVAPYLAAAVLLAIASWILKRPSFKGKFGEFQINRRLQKCLDSEKYHLIKDATLQTEDGTTQVDHILVSVFGVFVIETKNMGGKIFGQPGEKMWTQKFPWRKGYRFQNPRRQNYKHVQTVCALCNLEENQVHSVVVFVGSGRLQSGMPDDVVEGSGNLIDRIKSRTEEVLSPSEVGDVVDKINAGLSRSSKTHRAHVRHVNEDIVPKKRAKAGNFDKKSGADSSPSCPVCGGGMVERKVRKGEDKGKPFWGCPKFPQCRGMRPMNGHH